MAEGSVLSEFLHMLGTLLGQLSETVQSACGTAVASAVELSELAADVQTGEAADHERLKAAQGRMIMSLQFQDRHTQVIDDVTALLRKAQAMLANGNEMDSQALTTLAAVAKMGHVRAMLLSLGETAANDERAANASAIELF